MKYTQQHLLSKDDASRLPEPMTFSDESEENAFVLSDDALDEMAEVHL